MGKRRNRLLLVSYVAAALVCGGWMQSASAAGAKDPGTVVVIPARYRVFDVALDLVYLRGVTLVAYRGGADTEAPLVHWLDGREWVHVPLEELGDPDFLPTAPGRVIVVGADDDMPPALAAARSWSPRVGRVRAIAQADLLNAFDRYFQFSAGEWQAFAKKYQLKLRNASADSARRKYVRSRRTKPVATRPGRPRPLPQEPISRRVPSYIEEIEDEGEDLEPRPVE